VIERTKVKTYFCPALNCKKIAGGARRFFELKATEGQSCHGLFGHALGYDDAL
jgi:hypothetical protein